MTYKVSFIIPAYNAEKYILNCINSILSIQYENFEILIIDDGSTDNTRKKVSTITDSRVILLSQKNKGVSAARNRGIQNANGEYIAFIDADDSVFPDNYLLLINYLNEYSPEILAFDYNNIYNHFSEVCKINLPDGHYNKLQCERLRESLIDYKISENYKSTYMGAKVYQYLIKRECFSLQNIFPLNIHYAEDLCFFWRLFSDIQSIDIYHVCAYNYYIYDNSAAHKYRRQYWKELNSVYQYICEKKDNEQLLYAYVCEALNHYIYRTPITRPIELYTNVRIVINSINIRDILKNISFESWSKREIREQQLIAKKRILLYIFERQFLRIIKKIRK